VRLSLLDRSLFFKTEEKLTLRLVPLLLVGSGDSVTGTKSHVSSTTRSCSSCSGSLLTNASSLPSHSSRSLMSSNPNQSNRSLLTSSSCGSQHIQQPQRGCQQRLPRNRSFGSETPSHTSRWSSASGAVRKRQQQRDGLSNSLHVTTTESSSLARRGGRRQQLQPLRGDIVFRPQPPSQQQRPEAGHEILFLPDEIMEQKKRSTHIMAEPMQDTLLPRPQRRASASAVMLARAQQPSSSSLSSSIHNRPAASPGAAAGASAAAASSTRTRSQQHGLPSKRGVRPHPKPERRVSLDGVTPAPVTREISCSVAERRRIKNQQQQQQQRRCSTGSGPPVNNTNTNIMTRGRPIKKGSQLQPPTRSVSLGRAPRLEQKRGVSLGRAAPRLEPSPLDTSGQHSAHQHHCNFQTAMRNEGRTSNDLFSSNQFEYACALKKLEMKLAREQATTSGSSSGAHSSSLPPQSLLRSGAPPQRRASTDGGPAAAGVASNGQRQRRPSNEVGGSSIPRRKPVVKASRRASANASSRYSTACRCGDCPQCHHCAMKSSSSRSTPQPASSLYFY
jgi:hypothetical protein